MRNRAIFSIFTAGILLASLIGFASEPAGFITKEQVLSQLADLDARVEALKQELALNNNDAAIAEEIAALTKKYERLSASLGGDRPQPAGISENVVANYGNFLASAPSLPTCNPIYSSFTNSVPLAIPDGPAVVSSTLVVSGAGNYLWDLDLTTFLTHTFAADLDITLTSPAGTVVTITTDNGAGNDNSFNGTLWDGQANPGGQLPYTTNNGLTTDQAYVNLVTTTPIAPEESFGAFAGENPNGTWTITISDDLAGDGGSLDSWSLNLTSFQGAPVETVHQFSNSSPVGIPTGPAVVSSTLVASGAGSAITDIDLTTFITHTFAADLDITLTSPTGTVVTITTDNGAGNDNTFNGTIWADNANPVGQVPYTTNSGLVTDHAYQNLVLASPLVPEEGLAAFNGQDPNGTWTLTISDDLAGDGGSLDSWSLNISTGTCCPTITLSPPYMSGGAISAPYSNQITASGSSFPSTFAVSAGALPPGLTLAPGGLLSGIPSATGSFSFTVTATDSNGCTGSQSYTMGISNFNISLYDDYGRSRLCVNSYTGAYSWSILSGPNAGVYSGVGKVKWDGNSLFLAHRTNLGDYSVTALYEKSRRRAEGSFYYPGKGLISSIADTNTTNNPPGC